MSLMSFLIPIAHAAPGDPVVIPGAPALIPDCARVPGGADSLSCGIELFGNASQILLGVVGALMLILFVYGGILFLVSQGGDNVKKATGILQGAVVGLVIVFGAFSAVTFGVNALRGSDGGVPDATEFVSCSIGTDADGDPIAAPDTDGKPCGPGMVCSNGLCQDRVVPTN